MPYKNGKYIKNVVPNPYTKPNPVSAPVSPSLQGQSGTTHYGNRVQNVTPDMATLGKPILGGFRSDNLPYGKAPDGGTTQPQSILQRAIEKLKTPNPAWSRPVFGGEGSPTIGDVAVQSPIMGYVGAPLKGLSAAEKALQAKGAMRPATDNLLSKELIEALKQQRLNPSPKTRAAVQAAENALEKGAGTSTAHLGETGMAQAGMVSNAEKAYAQKLAETGSTDKAMQAYTLTKEREELARQEAVQLGRGIMPEGNIQDIMGRKADRLLGMDSTANTAPLGTIEQTISGKLDRIKSLATTKWIDSEAKAAGKSTAQWLDMTQKNAAKGQKVLSDYGVKGEELLTNGGMSASGTAKAAGGIADKGEEIVNTAKSRAIIDTLYKLTQTKVNGKLIVGVLGLAILGSTPFSMQMAANEQGDAADAYRFVMTNAITARDTEMQDKIIEAIAETREVKDYIWNYVPIVGYLRSNWIKLEAGFKATEMQKELGDKLAAQDLEEETKQAEQDKAFADAAALKQQNEEKNQAAYDASAALKQQNEEKNQKAYADAAALKQQRYEDYNTMAFERKQQADEEMRKYYADKLAAEQADEEATKQFWLKYQADKEAYWEEYQRKKKEDAPSKLGFGLL